MAYKYQQNMYSGAAEGYVKYNISPAPGTRVAPGETVTVSGQAYYRDAAVYGVVMDLSVGDLWTDSENYRTLPVASKAVRIAKGKTGTFSLSFAMTQEIAQTLGDLHGRGFDALISFMLADDSTLTSGTETMTVAAQKVSILKSRAEPVIESAAFSDGTDAAAEFGGFVQGESALVMTMQATTDPLDGAVTISRRVLTLGDAAYELAGDVHSIGAIDLYGNIAWTLTVTDSRGLSGQTSGTVRLLPYSPPVITALSAQRYAPQVADDGSTSYVPADDGEHVRFSLKGAVCALAEKNAWTLEVNWKDRTATVREGADGAAISLTEDREAVTEVISASERVEFAWTLRDFFHSVTMRAAVDKAGAYFNVEKDGVAVGMRSTGKAWDKKFEVAEKYKSHFYGGIFGADGYRMDRVVQYEPVEISNGSFTAYNSAYRPRISRVGPLVFLDGMVRNTSELAASFAQTIAVLPEWAWPAIDVHALHQGSGRALWWLRVSSDGAVTIQRYRTETGYVAAASSSQFPLSLSWIAADAFVAQAQEDGEIVVSYSGGVVTLTDDSGGLLFASDDSAGNVTIEKYGDASASHDGSGNVEIA